MQTEFKVGDWLQAGPFCIGQIEEILTFVECEVAVNWWFSDHVRNKLHYKMKQLEFYPKISDEEAMLFILEN